MAGGRRDGVGMVPVRHSEVEWEWITSSAVVTDHGSGLMDLPPQHPADRGRDTYRGTEGLDAIRRGPGGQDGAAPDGINPDS